MDKAIDVIGLRESGLGARLVFEPAFLKVGCDADVEAVGARCEDSFDFGGYAAFAQDDMLRSPVADLASR